MGLLNEMAKAAMKAVEKPLAKAGVKVAEKSAGNAERTVGRALANSAMKEGRYASKASYTKWLESMGGKTTKVESGFKNWEKSLPKFKSAEHVGVNSGKAAERAFVSGTKTTGKAVESAAVSGKTTGKAVEEAGKKAISINKESLKTAAKVGWQEGGKVINKTAGWAGQYARYSANHPIASLILSSIAYRQITGRTLLPDIMKSIGGDEATDKGLVGVLGDVTLGKKTDAQGREVGMVANLSDVLFGNGTYESIRAGVGSAASEAAGLYHGVKGGVASVFGEGAELYESGKERIGQYFAGNGMVANGNGGYYDPTTSSYPSTAQMMGTGPSSPSQPQNGIGGTMMNGVNAVANELTGGNVSKMNMLALLASAYMMFGRFGWLGKAGSLLLGGMTMRNINQHQPEGRTMQQMTQRAVEPAVMTTQSHSKIEFPETQEPVVRRSRGI